MKQKRGIQRILVQRTLVAVALAFGLAGGAWAHPSTQCDKNNVSQQGKTITVKPTGISDTKNLQCAIDLAVKTGRGAIIQLAGGVFNTGQLVATNFKGTIRGEGMNWGKGKKPTIIKNGPFLPITNRATWPFAPPSATNPWAVLLTFVDGDITMRDLAIQITGEKPIADGWDVAGLPTIYALSAPIAVVGARADLRVAGLSVSGEHSADKIYGFNVYNGILYQGGLAGSASPALAGLYQVRDSRFNNMGAGTPPAVVKDGVIVIENNTYKGVLWAGYIGGIANTNVRFANNNVHVVKNANAAFDTAYGIEVTDFPPYAFTDSRLFIAHNTFKGTRPAIGINATFGGKTGCAVILNDTSEKLPEIVLGPGTKECLVVTREPVTTVSNLGTNNRVIKVPRH